MNERDLIYKMFEYARESNIKTESKVERVVNKFLTEWEDAYDPRYDEDDRPSEWHSSYRLETHHDEMHKHHLSRANELKAQGGDESAIAAHLHKRKKDLKDKLDQNTVPVATTNNVQNNTVFVGSAKDLLDTLE